MIRPRGRKRKGELATKRTGKPLKSPEDRFAATISLANPIAGCTQNQKSFPLFLALLAVRPFSMLPQPQDIKPEIGETRESIIGINVMLDHVESEIIKPT